MLTSRDWKPRAFDWKACVEGACRALAERGADVTCHCTGSGRWTLVVDGEVVLVCHILIPNGLGNFVLCHEDYSGPEDYTDARTGEELSEAVLHHLSRRAS